MIRSYKGKLVVAVADGSVKKGFPPDLVRRAQLLLTVLHAAVALEDLRSPPGNHLERLVGDRDGQHSIRVNRQWRICFRWVDGGAEHVEIVDYH